MKRSQELIEMELKHGAHNYLPLPVVLSRGDGAKVWDVDGQEYLDFLACYSALNFGHKHPRLVKTLVDQAGTLAICSRAFHAEQLALFCKELSDYTGLDRVLPMNSGTEAVETALKIVRKWAYAKMNIPKHEANIIVMKNNFHGRSISVVSFSSEFTYRDAFGPFTPGFKLVDYGDVAAIEAAIDDRTVAVLMEPIQAEAGIIVPPEGYLKQVRELCTLRNIVFVLDEIQTGMGRTGKDFCYQHESADPDLLVLGKSLGGGLLPVSAVVGKDELVEIIYPGEHGSTFGGNPLACAVGREALAVLSEEKLSNRSAEIGEQIISTLKSANLPVIKEIRGKGALIGVELHLDSKGARQYCEDLASKGVLCKETREYVFRIAPPLVISDAELDLGLSRIIDVMGN